LIPILVFSRSPDAAQIKTRLASVLSAGQRAHLHQLMTTYACEQAVTAGVGRVRLYSDGNPLHDFFKGLNATLGVSLHSQQGNDLGERMANAIEDTFADAGTASQVDGVLVIGSDCPFMDAAYLQKAASALAHHEVVLAPAMDGGYTLIGLRESQPCIFSDIPWGTERVLRATLQRLCSSSLSAAILAPLPDIDRPQDLSLLNRTPVPPALREFAMRAVAD